MNGVVLAIALGYLALSLVVGLLPGRKASDSAEGFVAGDRALGSVVMYFITGATIFSAFAFLGMPGWAYSRGVAALYVIGYGTLGFLPFYFLGPRAWRVGKAYGFVTQAEMVAHRFRSPGLALVMALVSFLGFVPYLALQMNGAGRLLYELTDGGVPPWIGSAAVYGIVLIYVLRSGVLGVGWTNTLQGLLMLVLAWAIGLWLPAKLYGGVGPMFERIASERPELLAPPGLKNGAPWSWSDYTSSVVISILGFSMWPHLFMKAFSARDERTIRRTVALYPTFQVFLIPILFLGFAGVLYEPAPAHHDQVVPHMLLSMDLPPLAVGLFCAGALAASMSSGDGIAHAAGAILVRDGACASFGRRLTPHAERRWIRIAIVLVMGASYAFALLDTSDLVTKLLGYAYSWIVQFVPAVVCALYLRRVTGAGLLAGMVSGALTVALFLARPELKPWDLHAGAYGLAANVAALVLVSRFTHGDAARDEAFLATAAGRAGLRRRRSG